MIINKDIRKSLISILSSLFNKHLLVVYIEILIYGLLTIFILYKIGFWEFIYTKDTLLWLLFTATWLSFTTANNINKNNIFKNILKDTFNVTVFIEFLLNVYTFTIFIEIIAIIGLVLLAMLITHIDNSHDKIRYDGAYKLITTINSYIGLNIGIFLIVEVLSNFNNLLTLDTLKSFLLPILLTIIFIPFLYYLVIKISYEKVTLFIRLNKKASKLIVFYFKIRMYIFCRFNREKILNLKVKKKHLIINMQTIKDVNNIFNTNL